MQTYELMIILNPQVSDIQISEFIENAKKLIVNSKGEIITEDRLGRKKLSHQIGQNKDGFYIYIKMKATPDLVHDINRSLNLQELVLRTMILKTGFEQPVKTADKGRS
ncbi:MAG: 30S ribosomal protein S6 [Elusimicrobiota bacterium]